MTEESIRLTKPQARMLKHAADSDTGPLLRCLLPARSQVLALRLVRMKLLRETKSGGFQAFALTAAGRRAAESSS